jgi:hypothetical protein
VKKETSTEKSLRLLKKYLEETPQEQIDADIREIEAMNIGGPTVNEYFDGVQKQLENYMKSLHNINTS